MQNNTYNPDVLSCLANLSNDEVFTPPALANQMLDMLPAELWSNPDARFLDPCCKSGVFLREIAKRLIVGLEHQIPDLQERLNHIYKNQLFGIAITELTSLLARRSVYCSKNANSQYSICTDFNTECGNIVFERVKHTWENGRCKYCGASQSEYDRDDTLETHAYQFIHADEVFNMKFDVIIGNPPYQLNDGGFGASAIPLYHKFVQQAKALNAKFLTMIIPARWYAGGRGVDDFRDEMLQDQHIIKLVDFPVSTECFPGVDIQGGICYFLWSRDELGDCEITTINRQDKDVSTRPLLEIGCDIFIRYNKAVKIYRKVKSFAESSFADIVSSMKPFGLRTYVQGNIKQSAGAIKLYANKSVGWIDSSQISVNRQWLNKYKIFISRAYGMGDFPHPIIGKPILGEPNSCCTETYLHIGPFDDEKTAQNAISYIKTKFFRFMVLLIKGTQDAPKRVYSFVPMQDFSEPWDDAKLYKKYGLTADEIAFIESMVRPME